MELTIIEEITQRLTSERTHYSYFRDHYALGMLADLSESNLNMSTTGQVRDGPFASLLSKPMVKRALAAQGHGRLDARYLRAFGMEDGKPFLLGLDRWGTQADSWSSQASRRGHNLVLQLNFTATQTRALARLGNGDGAIFNSQYHPNCSEAHHRYRETLAWARIDLDFDRGEALIEEVQSDWVWFVNHAMRYGLRCGTSAISAERVKALVREHFGPVLKWWDEAVLWAALGFLRRELGIKHVFYHDSKPARRSKEFDISFHRAPYIHHYRGDFA
jgi:hypothetical protein